MATQTALPVIPVNTKRINHDRIVDFSDEENVKKFVRPSRWLAIDLGSFKVARFNWVVFTLASIVLWAFVIGVLAAPSNEDGANMALKEFGMWQSWITQNFTWFYIGTQVRPPCTRKNRLVRSRRSRCPCRGLSLTEHFVCT
jgi:hypothetical protein